MSAASHWSAWTITVLRVSSAAMILFKAVPSIVTMIAAGSITASSLLPLLMGILGALLLVGLMTRIAALLAMALMTVIYVAFHAPAGLSPAENGGVPAVLSACIFLHLMVSGPGRWSLDDLRGKSNPNDRAMDPS